MESRERFGEVQRPMTASPGQWALRGYGTWSCEKIDGAFNHNPPCGALI
jgi:hypothetical protein